jgi:hypothetical protein
MSEPLILKRASASRPSSQWSDEHYDVLADGKVIGRIYEDASASTLPELRWFWSITEIVPAAPKVTNGHAATLDEAEAQVSRGTLPLTMPPLTARASGSEDDGGLEAKIAPRQSYPIGRAPGLNCTLHDMCTGSTEHPAMYGT